MISDRKHLCLLVQVIDRGRYNTAGGYAEGRVLDSLKFLNEEWLGVGEPNSSSIHDKGLLGDKYGLLLLTPVGTSKGLGYVDTGDYRFDMGIEFQVSIEGHSQYTGTPFNRSFPFKSFPLKLFDIMLP